MSFINPSHHAPDIPRIATYNIHKGVQGIGPVRCPDIQQFFGALAGQRATKGVFISTSRFTQEAKDYAANSQYKVVLIDGERLAELMIEHDLGVSVAATYQLKRIDSDFFNEE